MSYEQFLSLHFAKYKINKQIHIEPDGKSKDTLIKYKDEIVSQILRCDKRLEYYRKMIDDQEMMG